MFYEKIRVPGLPGEEDVTDGSVDWYEMDWENVDNGVLESEMPKCPDGYPGCRAVHIKSKDITA